MNKHDLNRQHSLNEIVDAIECHDVNYTVEQIDDYFLCSADFWESLTPVAKAELIERYPHLRHDFPEE